MEIIAGLLELNQLMLINLISSHFPLWATEVWFKAAGYICQYLTKEGTHSVSLLFFGLNFKHLLFNTGTLKLIKIYNFSFDYWSVGFNRF